MYKDSGIPMKPSVYIMEKDHCGHFGNAVFVFVLFPLALGLWLYSLVDPVGDHGNNKRVDFFTYITP